MQDLHTTTLPTMPEIAQLTWQRVLQSVQSIAGFLADHDSYDLNRALQSLTPIVPLVLNNDYVWKDYPKDALATLIRDGIIKLAESSNFRAAFLLAALAEHCPVFAADPDPAQQFDIRLMRVRLAVEMDLAGLARAEMDNAHELLAQIPEEYPGRDGLREMAKKTSEKIAALSPPPADDRVSATDHRDIWQLLAPVL